jgi:hypothetical protein
MSSNIKFYKLTLVHNFLAESTKLKNQLLDELIIYATDPVKSMRRIRMLTQLCETEAQLLKKIENFQTDDPGDLTSHFLFPDINHVCDRSA